MPIVASDIVTRFTVKTGSAGDTTAGTAAGSLGGFTVHNLGHARQGYRDPDRRLGHLPGCRRVP